ncbi:hypothetical protein I3843_05G177500 [Carya illinoinensis]|nr:hypothetical protein I3843_05G177500 [Carya illinoinensis]
MAARSSPRPRRKVRSFSLVYYFTIVCIKALCLGFLFFLFLNFLSDRYFWFVGWICCLLDKLFVFPDGYFWVSRLDLLFVASPSHHSSHPLQMATRGSPRPCQKHIRRNQKMKFQKIEFV